MVSSTKKHNTIDRNIADNKLVAILYSRNEYLLELSMKIGFLLQYT